LNAIHALCEFQHLGRIQRIGEGSLGFRGWVIGGLAGGGDLGNAAGRLDPSPDAQRIAHDRLQLAVHLANLGEGFFEFL